MRAALILAACTLVGCGFDPSGLGVASSEGPADSGGFGGTDPSADGGSVDGADASVVPADGQDAFPTGAISFFRGSSCPAGWAPYEPARGRFVVATIGASAPGAVFGAPLASGEDRAHVHEFSVDFALGEHSYLLTVSGVGNGGVGEARTLTVAGTTAPVSTGLPYVQLLVCKKAAKPSSQPLPAGLQAFFDSGTCPSGWTQTEESQGRLVVGLPKGAPADQTYGGAPFSGPPRTHAHDAEAVLQTTSHGILAATGSGGGYASHGTYRATFQTKPSSSDLPTIELLSCTKT